MVVKVYISGISGNKEVKKRQQRVLMILDSKNIKYEIIDITEPGREADKDFMQNNSKSNGGTVSDPNPRSPLPPQVFNDEEYCGDYDQFDLANEIDTLEQFLKVELPPDNIAEEKVNAVNGDVKGSKENSQERDSTERVVKEPESAGDNEVEPKDGETDNKEAKETEEAKEETKLKEEESVEESKNTTDNIESNVLKEETSISNSEPANENGPAGSREVSEEKETKSIEPKDNPSEALIQSEQVAASE